MSKIKSLSISGFKSIRRLDDFELRDVSVLIGANGAGKSNFVSYFVMLQKLIQQQLRHWVSLQGGADRILSFGVKVTSELKTRIYFDRNGYYFCLQPTLGSEFAFQQESLLFEGDYKRSVLNLTPIPFESGLLGAKDTNQIARWCYVAISDWKVFHFHDTSETAGVKRPGSLIDIDYLRPDASNLAAFLFHLAGTYPPVYEQIRQTVRLAIPFFDDFVLRPDRRPNGEIQISLYWRQENSDYPMWPSQLSDGSIRFICLATALLQPHPPSTIIIDEPELGLHPYAITLLGALLKSASKRMQVIVSTQSVPLVNQFSIDDLIIVEREDGASVFKRHSEIDYQQWLEDYSVGELWEKNILGGRPPK